MKDLELYPEEESIIVYGSFEREEINSYEVLRKSDKKIKAEENEGIEKSSAQDKMSIYVGKPLGLLYSIFLMVFNVFAPLFL